MKRIVLLFFLLPVGYSVFSQSKIPLDHYVYEDWKRLTNSRISDNGEYISYEINPQKGDGSLYIYNFNNELISEIPRGYKADFLVNDNFIAGLIKPPADIVRMAKKKGKKKNSLPADSLFILDLISLKIQKFGNIQTFRTSKEEQAVIVFHQRGESFEPGDSASEIKDQKKLVKKYKLGDLVINVPGKNVYERFENIKDYAVAKNGSRIVFTQVLPDSVNISFITYTYNVSGKRLSVCHEDKGITRSPACSPDGKSVAFLYSGDTARVSGYELYHWYPGLERARLLIDSLGTGLPANTGISRYSALDFSENGQRIFFGTADFAEKEQKDTLLSEEKASLDVWSWADSYIQPYQKKNLQKEKKKTFLALYDLVDNHVVQLADKDVEKIIYSDKGDGDWFTGFTNKPYRQQWSWTGNLMGDIYSVNPRTGEKILRSEKVSGKLFLSVNSEYAVYYSRSDSAWISLNLESGVKINLCENLDVNFYNEENDIPMIPGSYGFAGFADKGRSVVLYDRYDVWQMDLSGRKEPVNLTAYYGRKHKMVLRVQKLNKDQKEICLDKPIYLSAFNEENMYSGFFRLTRGKIKKLVFGPHRYYDLKKSKSNAVFTYRKEDFKSYGDLYITDKNWESQDKISQANPQMENYLWGDVRLVDWVSLSGDSLKGLLYTPENYTPEKKYPLLVYFYEKYSHRLYSHFTPAPSRSIINPTFCVSNGYVVFIPDIKYRTGYPGQSAYDAIISGTRAMLDRYSFIDSTRMGLQGQSWGGYQVAWLITRTNMFTAAMAGAPVSNMTSAYGGIRWGSGRSRMFQYEKTQSRIGGNLWENQDLYIENSPLFFVPEINTPVLIMHNDHDGAVPWYQGIEFFMSLRRLNKPAWMLSYNNEEHNLTRWPNRVDLDIRMMQFFNYYLKDEILPDWMKQGVPALLKNRTNGRDLLEINRK